MIGHTYALLLFPGTVFSCKTLLTSVAEVVRAFSAGGISGLRSAVARLQETRELDIGGKHLRC